MDTFRACLSACEPVTPSASPGLARRADQVAWVRELARACAEIAHSGAMEQTRCRWRAVYTLRPADRAPVWLRLDGMCQRELLPPEELVCTDPFLRDLEQRLRLALRHRVFGDDTILLPYWKVPAAIQHDGQHLWGVPVGRHLPDAPDGAWSYDPPLRVPGDLRRVRVPRWYRDAATTERRLSRHAEILQGILPVRLSALPPLFPGIGRNATDLIGLEGLLVGMAADPDFVHRLMGLMRDSVLQCLDDVEAMGVLTENNDDPIHFTPSLKETPASHPVRIGDLWLRTESQQFQGVSAVMWREFLLAYQRPIMARFRWVSYGCCENLTDRLDALLALPNLRILVSSPWTDWSAVVRACGDRYALIWRQSASDVVFSLTMAQLRSHLVAGLGASKGCHRAVVLQEVATFHGRPQRLVEWVDMARRAAEDLT